VAEDEAGDLNEDPGLLGPEKRGLGGHALDGTNAPSPPKRPPG
jgi:hypothetical protein